MSFILLVEQVAPETPSTAQVILYPKADGRMYTKGDNGIELALQAFIEAGTRMLFQQTAAPTGWTKETSATYNDAALRFVTGTAVTGGVDPFSTHFGTGKSTAGHILTSTEMPSHTHVQDAHSHTQRVGTDGGGATTGADNSNTINENGGSTLTTVATNQNTGGGGAHAHTLLNMDLKFADCIIASKD